MTATKGADPRHVVPRWRSYRKTVDIGELDFLQSDSQRDLGRGLAEAEHDWIRSQTIIHAAEFAGAAITAGVPERARDTLTVLRQSDNTYRKVGNALYRLISPRQSMLLVENDPMHRSMLSRDPRNVIAWLELSRVQFCHGHADAARRSMTVAVQLAPHNRFVLRSATALSVSIGDPGWALSILTPVASMSNDPWLLSAEIAVSSLVERRSKLIRKGHSLLRQGVWDNQAISELSSEIGTLEASSGNDKKARQLFDLSLTDPTENAVAQAISVSLGAPELIPDVLDRAAQHYAIDASEAQALRSEKEARLGDAVEYAKAWLDDQPFSLRASIYASYIASAGNEDWGNAVGLARRGLRVHPRNANLLNNLAYALIESGSDLNDARKVLIRAEGATNDRRNNIAILATKGLLEYRLGNEDAGRFLYERATTKARKSKDSELESRALLMHANEISSVDDARIMLARARRVGDNQDAVFHALLARTESRIPARSKRDHNA